MRFGTRTVPAELLAPVDEVNLVLDHVGQVNVFLCAGLLAPGGFVDAECQPDLTALRAAIAARVASISSLRRVPAPSARGHRWVEVAPDLEQHVRVSEPVDGRAGLERACGRLMTVPLPLDRPLWELLIVPGAGVGRVGFVLRIHHATADGIAAVAIVHELFDRAELRMPPAGGSAVPLTPGAPAARGVKRGMHAGRKLISALHRVILTLVGRGMGPTVLLGDRGSERGVLFIDADIEALKAHVHPLGATLNDALLAASASGYVAALSAAGEATPAQLPVSMPLALRRRGSSANQVGVMLVRLPVGIRDPERRLERIAATTRAEKDRAREQGTLEFMRGPLGARIMDRIAHRQHLVAGFVTNVPGPPERMFLAGAPVVAVWPVAVLAANVRLGVAAASYAGRLWCGIHFDAASVPGAPFAQAMNDEFTRLSAERRV